MRRVCVIQARMGSTRLPRKVLRPLRGRPMLARQIQRLSGCQNLDEIVIATSTLAGDDPLAELARELGLRCVRGSEADVLSRYRLAAQDARADVVVRVTADCPLIDADVTDAVVAALLDGGVDYASNVSLRTYPRGLDVEALWVDVVERMHRMASSSAEREHVTLMVHRRPALFATRDVVDLENNSDLRWTVDTPEDFALVERVYDELGLGEQYRPYREILDHVRRSPELSAMNQHVEQKIA